MKACSKKRSGQTMTEYIIIVALIAVVLVCYSIAQQRQQSEEAALRRWAFESAVGATQEEFYELGNRGCGES